MDYLLVGWELDLLDGGNLIDHSHHVGCLLVHRVGCSTRRDDLQGAMYIRGDNSVYDVPRNVRCDRTSCGFLRPSTRLMLLATLRLTT